MRRAHCCECHAHIAVTCIPHRPCYHPAVTHSAPAVTCSTPAVTCSAPAVTCSAPAIIIRSHPWHGHHLPTFSSLPPASPAMCMYEVQSNALQIHTCCAPPSLRVPYPCVPSPCVPSPCVPSPCVPSPCVPSPCVPSPCVPSLPVCPLLVCPLPVRPFPALLPLRDMHGCNLTSLIPATVGCLLSLKYFLVNQNRLLGSIPSTVSALQQLYMWDVMDNLICCTVPSFGGASELVHLCVGCGVGVVWHGCGIGVAWVWYSRNLLSSVPDHIGWLPKLEHVLVDGNRHTHPNLSFPLSPPPNPPPHRISGRYWSNNLLPSLPTTWFLPKLRDFDLSNNFIGGIPATLFQQNPNLINL
ncbi:unnamed protein product [Closterium sp. NIES-64]|nr:unnamed protein product [Closterium sp. NIES-64]